MDRRYRQRKTSGKEGSTIGSGASAGPELLGGLRLPPNPPLGMQAWRSSYVHTRLVELDQVPRLGPMGVCARRSACGYSHGFGVVAMACVAAAQVRCTGMGKAIAWQA